MSGVSNRDWQWSHREWHVDLGTGFAVMLIEAIHQKYSIVTIYWRKHIPQAYFALITSLHYKIVHWPWKTFKERLLKANDYLWMEHLIQFSLEAQWKLSKHIPLYAKNLLYICQEAGPVLHLSVEFLYSCLSYIIKEQSQRSHITWSPVLSPT